MLDLFDIACPPAAAESDGIRLRVSIRIGSLAL
jgi:hypothetical protein